MLNKSLLRLAPVLKTIFHQCVISYTCSLSNSDGSVKTEPSELDWLQVYVYVISYTCSQSNSDGSVKTEPSELDWLQVYDMTC